MQASGRKIVAYALICYSISQCRSSPKATNSTSLEQEPLGASEHRVYRTAACLNYSAGQSPFIILNLFSVCEIGKYAQESCNFVIHTNDANI